MFKTFCTAEDSFLAQLRESVLAQFGGQLAVDIRQHVFIQLSILLTDQVAAQLCDVLVDFGEEQ